MAFTFNGIGTRYYGTRWLPDGTHITTKWIVLIYVPLIPLGSVRVLEASAPYGTIASSGQLLSVQAVPLDIGMVVRTYAWIVGAAVGLAVLTSIDRIVLGGMDFGVRLGGTLQTLHLYPRSY
jgi:hypothetical protein